MARSVKEECQRFLEIKNALRAVLMYNPYMGQNLRGVHGYACIKAEGAASALQKLKEEGFPRSDVWARGERERFLELCEEEQKDILQFNISDMRDEVLKEEGLSVEEWQGKYAIDKSQYSRIANGGEKMSAVFARKLIIALHMSLAEAKAFLNRYGHDFNKNTMEDLYLVFCLREGNYDPRRIDEVMYNLKGKTIFCPQMSIVNTEEITK